MAIIDSRLAFADSLDCDAEIGTVLATNQIDLLAAGLNIGNGTPVYLCMAVTEAFTDGGDAATLTVRLCSDDSASVHATTSTIHIDSGALLKAALTLGAKFAWPLPVSGSAYERYLGVNLITGTAGFDAGMVDLFLSTDPGIWAAYNDATN